VTARRGQVRALGVGVTLLLLFGVLDAHQVYVFPPSRFRRLVTRSCPALCRQSALTPSHASTAPRPAMSRCFLASCFTLLTTYA